MESFNSRAREGRDRYTATDNICNPLFQFTRPRGARPEDIQNISASACFNSRAREGRDVFHSEPLFHFLVSIHAPARGATNRRLASALVKCFNSRAREGRDVDHPDGRPDRRRFQFTRPRGARPNTRAALLNLSCFNSRAREGRDTKWKARWKVSNSFNSRAREGRDKDNDFKNL